MKTYLKELAGMMLFAFVLVIFFVGIAQPQDTTCYQPVNGSYVVTPCL